MLAAFINIYKLLRSSDLLTQLKMVQIAQTVALAATCLGVLQSGERQFVNAQDFALPLLALGLRREHEGGKRLYCMPVHSSAFKTISGMLFSLYGYTSASWGIRYLQHFNQGEQRLGGLPDEQAWKRVVDMPKAPLAILLFFVNLLFTVSTSIAKLPFSQCSTWHLLCTTSITELQGGGA